MRNMLTRIGFIDETSLKTNMAKTTGWSPCGARLVDHAPFGHWQTQTFMAAMASGCITDERQGLVTVTSTVLVTAGTIA